MIDKKLRKQNKRKLKTVERSKKNNTTQKQKEIKALITKFVKSAKSDLKILATS